MTELSPRTRELIAAANRDEVMGTDARMRGARRLQQALLSAGVVSAVSATAASTHGASSIGAASTVTSSVASGSAGVAGATVVNTVVNTVATTAAIGTSAGVAASGTTLAGLGAKVVLLAGLGFVGAGVTHQAAKLVANPAALTDAAVAGSSVAESGSDFLAEHTGGAELAGHGRAATVDPAGELPDMAATEPVPTGSSSQATPRASRRSEREAPGVPRAPSASSTTGSAARAPGKRVQLAPPAAGAGPGVVQPEAHNDAGLRAEVRRLSEAERLLASGHADEAARLLSADAATGASNALAIERRALRLVAGCRSRDARARLEARVQALAFEREHADSPLLGRVRVECQTGRR